MEGHRRIHRILVLEELEPRLAPATLWVANTNDGGVDSLRSAIAQANAMVGADVIRFDSVLIGQTITLTTGQLNITDGLTIIGLGAANLTIDGNSNSRIFHVDDGEGDGADVVVTMSGLTLTNGDPGGDGGAVFSVEDLTIDACTISGNRASGNGGGLYNGGMVMVQNCTISGNTATAEGGGIYNSGTLHIRNGSVIGGAGAGNSAQYGGGISNWGMATVAASTVIGNSATNDGGAIVNAGALTVTTSAVSANTSGGSGGGIANAGALTVDTSSVGGNTATQGGGGLYNEATLIVINASTIIGNTADTGGGIYNAAGIATITAATVSANTAAFGGGILNMATLNLTASTISGNTATDDTMGGGGIANGGTATITNSTISGNSATGGGGGVLAGALSTTTILNTTSANNTADSDGNGNGNGGGIRMNGGTVTLVSTIVGDDRRGFASVVADDIYGAVTADYSLIETTAGATISGANNVLNQDPLLGPLADNGGPTRTHRLIPGSPAIDVGSNPLVLIADQRGVGHPRQVGPAPDIGAYESGGNGLILSRFNPRYQFVDGDGDLIRLIYGGPGEAIVAAADGGAPDGEDIAFVMFRNTTSKSKLIVKDRDPRNTPNTMTAGAMQTTGGDSMGVLKFLTPRGTLWDTNITIEGNLKQLNVRGDVDALAVNTVNVGGHLTKFNGVGSISNTLVMVTGNVSGKVLVKADLDSSYFIIGGTLPQAKVTGEMTDSAFLAATLNQFSAGSMADSEAFATTWAGQFKCLGDMTNSQFHSGGDALYYYVAGHVTGLIGGDSAMEVGGDVERIVVKGGMTDADVDVQGKTGLLKVLCGMDGATTVDLGGSVTTVCILGMSGGASVGIGSVVTLGRDLKGAVLLGGELAGRLEIVRSARDTEITIQGDLTGELLARVFGDVTILGSLTGSITAVAGGYGNVLCVTGLSVPGAVTPANAFATYIGYP